jgi:protein-tyrosine phosphatase
MVVSDPFEGRTVSSLTANEIAKLFRRLGRKNEKLMDLIVEKGIDGKKLASLKTPQELTTLIRNELGSEIDDCYENNKLILDIVSVFNKFAESHLDDESAVFLQSASKQYNIYDWGNRRIGNFKIPATRTLPFNETSFCISRPKPDYWYKLDPKSPDARSYYETNHMLNDNIISGLGSVFTTRLPRAIDFQEMEKGGVVRWTGEEKEKYAYGVTDIDLLARRIYENAISLVIMLPEENELEKVSSSKLIQFYQSCGVKVVHTPFEDFTAPSKSLTHKDVSLIAMTLVEGKNCLVHCFGGSGRTGTIVIGALANLGLFSPDGAIKWAHTVKSTYIETPEQWDVVLGEGHEKVWKDVSFTSSVRIMEIYNTNSSKTHLEDVKIDVSPDVKKKCCIIS